MKLKLLFLSLLLVCACSTGSERFLGESVTLKPGWERLKQSSKEAFSDPNVWASLVAAALLQSKDLDQQISDRLYQESPVFGSTSRAAQRSDDFRDLTGLAHISTALLAPGPADTQAWLVTKGQLLAAEYVAVKSARSMTSVLKSISRRERPNGLNNRSFPSGHTTSAAIQAQMAILNIEHLSLNDNQRNMLNWSLYGSAGLTAWARVESGMHYPSDVLAGWAVGHFVSHLAESFITPDKTIRVYPELSGYGFGIRLVANY